MKVYRSKEFDISNPMIWKSRILKLGDGPVFVAKAIVTGLEFMANKISFGPLVFRRYDQEKDKNLGLWSGRCCVLELKFQDEVINPPQDTPLSMYVYPFWAMYSIFIALQLYVDSWVGMKEIHYFNKRGKHVGAFGGRITEVADSRSITKEPVVKRLSRRRLLKLMKVQYGLLELAIDRYSRACTEIVDESIIDFVIVLESLLGIGLGSEIAHRVSMRGTFLLSPNIKIREQYYAVFKYFYDLRSKMVHGKIDEIKCPGRNSKSRVALVNLGAELSGEWSEDRFEISDIARKLTRKVLLYFVDHEDKWNDIFLKRLELDMDRSVKYERL